MPFPTTVELLTWPMVKEMVEEDRSVEELEEAFTERRGEIDEALSEWRDKVLREVLEIWRQESEEKEEAKAEAEGSKGEQKATKGSARKAQDVSLARAKTRRKSRKGKERASAAPDLTCGTTLPQTVVTFTKPDGTTTEDVEDLPEDWRLLFRADTLFSSLFCSPFYPDLLPGHFNAFVATDGGMMMPDLGRTWKPEDVKRDDSGSAMAKVLLDLLGIPDATYPQMKAAGQAFLCQRCSHEVPDSWERIVSCFIS